MRLHPLLAAWVAATAATGAAAAAPPADDSLRADPAQVLAGTPRNGAVTQMPGETYIGPGPMTVAWLGAKKQLVLPNGRWVLLAMGDLQSHHNTPVALVNLVFGQFGQGRLRSLMSYVFTGRPVNARTSWSDVDKCRQADRPEPHKVVLQDSAVSLCALATRRGQWRPPSSEAWDRTLAALVRLGTTLPEGPVVDSYAVATDQQGGMLTVRRYDFSGPGADAAARMPWLRAYATPMLSGMRRQIPDDELEAGTVPAPRTLTLPD